MTLTKFRPANRLDFLNKHLGGFLNSTQNDDELIQQIWKPRVDIIEEEKQYKVLADLPGMKKDDVSITLEDNILAISGERKIEKKNKKDGYYFNERVQGKFSRRFNLKNSINVEDINASFNNGVLTITLPKKEAVLPRSIEISSAK